MSYSHPHDRAHARIAAEAARFPSAVELYSEPHLRLAEHDLAIELKRCTDLQEYGLAVKLTP
jgi:hypothetical protein